MTVTRYTPERKREWDEAVRVSKNGTFLFLRDYLEYHQDRFVDHSLMVFKDARLIAAMPGHAVGRKYVSHAGVTHGGLIVDQSIRLPAMLEVFDVIADDLIQAGFTSWFYKTVPSIYHAAPAEEDRYALFLLDAPVVRRGILSVVDPGARPAFQERRQRRIKQATRAGVVVRESTDLEQYWDILTARLREMFGATPVHSLEEIALLRDRFPSHIRLFAAFEHEVMTAGIVVFEHERVARTQYIAANQAGRDSGAIDLVIARLITHVFAQKAHIDLGTSDEADGRRLNQGLIEHKEGFGGRSVAQDHYEVDLTRGLRCASALSGFSSSRAHRSSPPPE